MEIKFIHTGDVHLGTEFNNAGFGSDIGKVRRKEIMDTFFRIIDRVKSEHIDLLLIAGDLFEEKCFSIGDAKKINSKFKEIPQTKIVIVAGNHDPITEKSLYKIINWEDNVILFTSNEVSKVEIKELDLVIWGLSWDKKEEKSNLLKNIHLDNKDNINILLVHGDVYSQNSKYLPIDKKLLCDKGFDYIALGHIHKHEFISNNMGYCGSPEPLDFGETGTHGIIQGKVSKFNLETKFIPLSKREFKIIEVEVTESMNYFNIKDNIKKCVAESCRRNDLFRIIVKGIKDRHIQLDKLQAELCDNFYYIEIIDNTIPDYDLNKIEKENTDNIIGLFIKEMKKKGLEKQYVKNALYYGLELLLSEKVKIIDN